MSTEQKTELNILQKADLLLKLQTGQNIDDLLAGLSALQLQETQNFLIEEIQYIHRLNDNPTPSTEEIKSNFETATNYYYKQDCKEPLESCFDESCFKANPACFSKKMRSHISVLTNLLLPLFNKNMAE